MSAHLREAWRKLAAAGSLQEVIDAFDPQGCTDPATAESKCYDVSVEFADLVGGEIGRYSNPIGFQRLPYWADPNDMDAEGGVGHAAVHVGDMVVDWTARQFWPGAPVPVVEPFSVYRQRFERYEGLD